MVTKLSRPIVDAFSTSRSVPHASQRFNPGPARFSRFAPGFLTTPTPGERHSRGRDEASRLRSTMLRGASTMTAQVREEVREQVAPPKVRPDQKKLERELKAIEGGGKWLRRLLTLLVI